MKFQVAFVFLFLADSIASTSKYLDFNKYQAPVYHKQQQRIRPYPIRKTFKEHALLPQNSGYIVQTQSYSNTANHEGWGMNKDNEAEKRAKEIVKFIYQFLGVMGPFLFPLPYVLAMIPFAIPAIPLSFWLETRRTEGEAGEGHGPGGGEGHGPGGGASHGPGDGEGHSPGGGEGHGQGGGEGHSSGVGGGVSHEPTKNETAVRPLNPHHPQQPESPTTTTTQTPYTTSTKFNPPVPLPQVVAPNVPIIQTTSVPQPNNNNTISVTNNSGDTVEESPGSTSNNGNGTDSSDFANFPMNMTIGDFNLPPVTLFPYTLYLNSSFLGPDYYNEED